MLTPSLVLAYWMRGSMAGLFYSIRQRTGSIGGKIEEGKRVKRSL